MHSRGLVPFLKSEDSVRDLKYNSRRAVPALLSRKEDPLLKKRRERWGWGGRARPVTDTSLEGKQEVHDDRDHDTEYVLVLVFDLFP